MTVARQFVEAFNRRDLDGLVGCFTDDATYHDLFYGHFRGHDSLRKLFDRMFIIVLNSSNPFAFVRSHDCISPVSERLFSFKLSQTPFLLSSTGP